MRYCIRIEYDGTAYNGWQRQINGPSIQQELETAFAIVLRRKCAIVGAGRTDAGVHARRQAAHVELDGPVDIAVCERSVNAVLPRDIAVFDMRVVGDSFHARYSALTRTYRYYIMTVKSPLERHRAWSVFYHIDWEMLRRITSCLNGTHDFTAFCSSGTGSGNAICTVHETLLVEQGTQWVFSITANRFVYKMVRSIVGTLIDIGRGAIEETLESILLCGERRRAGNTAPPWGLFLEDVRYPRENV